MCPKKCPNFGHIVDIFWILLPCLDIFCAPNYKCPKCDQPELNVSIKCPKIGHIMDISLQFGCFLDIISKVGHVLGIIWTHCGVWSLFTCGSRSTNYRFPCRNYVDDLNLLTKFKINIIHRKFNLML